MNAVFGLVPHHRARAVDHRIGDFLVAVRGQAVKEQRVALGLGHQRIVPLEGESLARACESYFFQSEQVPTLIRVGVHTENGQCVAGGMVVQHLPDGEEGRERLHARLDHPEWEHVAALAGSLRADELTDPDLSLEAVVWRLFHEEDEVRVTKGPVLTRGCRCTSDYYRDILARFGEAERAEMENEDGEIVVDCAFCSRLFPIRFE